MLELFSMQVHPAKVFLECVREISGKELLVRQPEETCPDKRDVTNLLLARKAACKCHRKS